jgi:hypothetical protein
VNFDLLASRDEELSLRRDRFASDGFVMFRSILTGAEAEGLKRALSAHDNPARAGVRGLLERCPEVRSFARQERITAALTSLIGAVPFAVRGILFDKSASANWSVGWHQDLAIAVQQRADVFGFGQWSIKEGVVHAHAPAGLLERMLAVRVHLDDADETNGALQVLPGSHLAGKLCPSEIDRTVASIRPVTCVAHSGDVLVMRPLLLHASAAAATPVHRRVVHIEYAMDELPPPLQWYERVG